MKVNGVIIPIQEYEKFKEIEKQKTERINIVTRQQKKYDRIRMEDVHVVEVNGGLLLDYLKKNKMIPESTTHIQLSNGG